MEPADAQTVSALLQRMAAGDALAAETLLPFVYGELRELAARLMSEQKAGHTLQPTALIHEAWLRISGSTFQSPDHFAAVAAKAMRSVLVDYARRKQSQKRGGTFERVELDSLAELFAEGSPDMLALDSALDRLARMDPDLARVVELRFFAGLSVEETARVLTWSTATVTRSWRVARLWLLRELGPQGGSAN